MVNEVLKQSPFDPAAAVYDRIRPGYPAAAFDAMLAEKA
jgi:hypothetical protein